MFFNRFWQPWAIKAAQRVGANLIIGALLTALVGALCVGTAGAIIGAIMDIRSTPPAWSLGFSAAGADVGMTLGSWSGILGALIFGIAALTARPGRLFAPITAIKRVALGQFLGTLGALSTYLLAAAFIAQTRGQSFVVTVEDNALIILVGAPLMMLCGAIAGALWRREAQR